MMTSAYNLPLYDAREHTTNNGVDKVGAQAINEEVNPGHRSSTSRTSSPPTPQGTALRYVGLRSRRYKSTIPHYQGLDVSHTQSNSEEDNHVDGDKCTRVNTTGPKVNN